MDCTQIKEGDTVTRLLAEAVPMTLKVTQVDDALIHCGPWTFDRETGVEVDHDLAWGPTYGVSGSRLVSQSDES